MGAAVALALIVSYVESLIPFYFGIPGAKLGLTNIVIIILLYRFGIKEAFFVSLARIFLAGFLFGNLFGILYSLGGGIFSLCMMTLLKRTKNYSVKGVSLGGGVCHNMAQLAVAALVMENIHIIYYLPILMIAGVITGTAIGILAEEIMKRTAV